MCSLYLVKSFLLFLIFHIAYLKFCFLLSMPLMSYVKLILTLDLLYFIECFKVSYFPVEAFQTPSITQCMPFCSKLQNNLLFNAFEREPSLKLSLSAVVVSWHICMLQMFCHVVCLFAYSQS